MSLAVRRPRNHGLGHHRRRARAGMTIGIDTNTPTGLSWLTDSQEWDARPRDFAGGLSMDPVTFKRLLNFLTTHSHTGMGHATPALSRDTGGISGLAIERAYDQAADEVIGPRSRLFREEDL